MAENTLGEKLRQAREERGLSLSEVADQTRISSLYLESIENDDYRILPGGIFNKGFVKSYAKFVGINEQEALADYSRLIAETQGPGHEEVKSYRPEVLTDDRTSGSMALTVITAVIILGLMTGGILFLINYLRQPAETTANVVVNANTNSSIDTTANTVSDAPPASPELGASKIEFKATTEPVSLTALTDGKSSSNVVPAGSSVVFEPKESIKLSYSRSLARSVQLTINGKNIALPSTPVNPRRNVIEFEINRENLAAIWTSGSVFPDQQAVASAGNVNSVPLESPAGATPPPTGQPPVSTPLGDPTAIRTPVRTPAAPRPAANSPAAPPANRPAAKPTVRPNVITVPSANRP